MDIDERVGRIINAVLNAEDMGDDPDRWVKLELLSLQMNVCRELRDAFASGGENAVTQTMVNYGLAEKVMAKKCGVHVEREKP